MSLAAEVLQAEGLRRLGVLHGFTTRRAQDLGYDPAALVTLNQVHGAVVLWVDRPAAELPPQVERRADALITDRPDTTLGVRTADCLPLLLYCRDPEACAAVHAGWRGTLAGVVPAAVAALGQRFGCRPADLVAALGPCIRVANYEVGPEVFAPFLQRFGAEAAVELDGVRRVDLVTANRRLLLLAGLAPENVEVVGGCTFGEPARYFSYRRDGARTGRQLAFIGLAPGAG